jgi:hypothetical protein
MNVILDKLQDLKFLFLSIALVFVLGGAFGWVLSPKPKPKELVCKREIEQIQILSLQLKEMRKKHLDEIKKFQEKCALEQGKLCSEKMLRYRSACLELKCEICKESR